MFNSENKTHYKMYKAGKSWLFGAITVTMFTAGITGGTLLSNGKSVHADTTVATQSQDSSSSTSSDTANAQDSSVKTSETKVAPEVSQTNTTTSTTASDNDQKTTTQVDDNSQSKDVKDTTAQNTDANSDQAKTDSSKQSVNAPKIDTNGVSQDKSGVKQNSGDKVVDQSNNDTNNIDQNKTNADNQAVAINDDDQNKAINNTPVLAATNDNQSDSNYDAMEAEYQKELAEYNDAEAKFKEQEAQYQKDLAEYNTNSADYQAAEAQYQKDLAEYNDAKAAFDQKEAEYQKEEAAYKDAEAAYQTAEKNYQDNDLPAYQAAEKDYQDKEAKYKDAVNSYNIAKIDYDNKEAKYLSDLSAYNQAEKDYQDKEAKYKTDYANWQKSAAAWGVAKDAYDAQQAQYLKDLAAYNAAVAKAKASGEIVPNAVHNDMNVYPSPDAKVQISIADGSGITLQNQSNDPTIDYSGRDSKEQWRINLPGNLQGSQEDPLVTLTFTNLNGDYTDPTTGVKHSIIKRVDRFFLPKNLQGMIIYSDPVDGYWVCPTWQGNEAGIQKATTYYDENGNPINFVDGTAYAEVKSLNNYSNQTDPSQPHWVEHSKIISGGEAKAIAGSSIKNHNGDLYADSDNSDDPLTWSYLTDDQKQEWKDDLAAANGNWGQARDQFYPKYFWDSQGSKNNYYGSGVFQYNGSTIVTYDYVSGDVNQQGLPGSWTVYSSNMEGSSTIVKPTPLPPYPDAPVAPDAPQEPTKPTPPTVPSIPDNPPVEPTAPTAPVPPVEPTAPTAPVPPVEPTAPTAPVPPVAPIKPIAPTKPETPQEPQKPGTPVNQGETVVPGTNNSQKEQSPEVSKKDALPQTGQDASNSLMSIFGMILLAILGLFGLDSFKKRNENN